MFQKVRPYSYIRRLIPTFDQNLTFLTTPLKMEDPNSTPPPTTYGSNTDASFLAAESTGSAPGSFQNDGILSGGADSTGYDLEFGFQRLEFGQEKIAGTVQIYDRHVFLCYKTPQVWPANVENAEFDRLPRLLSASLKARKGDMRKRTRLTICEGEDGTESSNGDVLIFPDMIRYRRLTHFDVDNFVEETLVKDAEWLPGEAETLLGSFVFVCAHGSRDKRCGVCGPVLIKKFKEEINSRGLQDQISVSSCSHIGGHKYAGNVIIFSPSADGNVTGHWYGYVCPDNVPGLIEQHIGKGEILRHLWRGQMGLSENEQKKVFDRLELNGDIQSEKITKDIQIETIEVTNFKAGGCCQGNGNSSCCQSISPEEKLQDYIEEVHVSSEAVEKSSKASKVTCGSKGASTRKICALPTWFECWEREDTYAALAVVAAAVSVGIAYGCYKHLK